MPPVSTYRIKFATSSGLSFSLGEARIKRLAFLIFSYSIDSLLSPIYIQGKAYLIGFLVFFGEFFKVGAGVSIFLLRGVEDDLGYLVWVTTLPLICPSLTLFKYLIQFKHCADSKLPTNNQTNKNEM